MDVSVLVDRLASMKKTVATAESCTGGLIASSIVDIAGASDCFNEGYVTYSNEAKMKNLHVKEATLLQYGAVSTQTAKEMAIGVQKVAHADFGVASTGIAGPGGGTPTKPVGLVYIACAYRHKCQVRQLNLSGDRSQVRHKAADEALQLLSDCMDEIGE